MNVFHVLALVVFVWGTGITLGWRLSHLQMGHRLKTEALREIFEKVNPKGAEYIDTLDNTMRTYPRGRGEFDR